MRRVRILPLRRDESKNYRSGWRSRSQVLASILLWARDAGADTINFDPSLNEPFLYLAANTQIAETEMGPTPSEHVETLPQYIRDVVDGHPIARPIRRMFRSIFGLAHEAILDVPGYDDTSDSSWHVRVLGDRATFTLAETNTAVR